MALGASFHVGAWRPRPFLERVSRLECDRVEETLFCLGEHVREPNMKTKYLVLLREPFSSVCRTQTASAWSSCRMSKWPQNGRRAAVRLALTMGIHSVSVRVRMVRGRL